MVRQLVLGLLLLIVIGVFGSAVRELIRGTIWLRTTDTPFHQEAMHGSGFQLEARQMARRSWLKNDLKMTAIALHNYHDIYGSFPAGGTFADNGEGMHSWISALDGVAMYSFGGQLRLDEPWDSEYNQKFFRSVLYDVINPTLPAAPVVNEDGFALSHFAANQHVMGPNLSLKIEDITDGPANTLMIGEVNSLFQPWGAPTNWRDPMLGLNTSPRGFGSHPDAGGVMFVIGDGSVRFLSNDIDPEVLKALSTPAGGESIHEQDW